MLLKEETISQFRKGYVAAFGGGISKDPIYAAIAEGIRSQGIEHYLPLFYPDMETIFEYVGSDTLIAFDGLLEEARIERRDLVADFYESRAERAEERDTGSGDPAKIAGVFRPLSINQLYLGDDGWAEYKDSHLSLIHISEPTRRYAISYAVFCLKK